MENYEKKYKEALEKARQLCAYPTTKSFISDLQDLFPELKESEDEKIRQKILFLFYAWRNNEQVNIPNKKEVEKAIAWLEKQTDQTDIANKEYWRGYREGKKEILDKYAEQSKQKPAEWSKEDEVGFGDALWAIEQAKTIAKDENDMGNLWYAEGWLKSIKDRVLPQPKQEWSEKDEEILRTILSDGIRGAELDMLQVNWLKSLRPLKRWKPSEEQIKVCKEVYADLLSAKGFDLGTVNDELNRMEEELKKLKEE